MSWWTNVRDTAINIGTAGMYDPRSARHQESEMNQSVQAQINAYNKMSELTQQEINAKKNEEDAVKRQVEEKQIRALRAGHRGIGISPDVQPGPTDQTGMTNKLGG